MKLLCQSFRVLLNTEAKYLTNASLIPIIVANYQQSRNYAPAKKKTLTESQIQLQKHAAEMGFKEKTSIRATLFEYHDVDESIQYMKSEAFKKAYKEKLLWEWYIRNYKGRYPKGLTRQQCVGNGRYLTGNPCPICRDPYLVVSYKNLELLRHFVSPDTGHILPASTTNVCQKQQGNLEVAFGKACDYGLIDHYIPHRMYDYSQYHGFKQSTNERPSVLLGIVLGANRQKINTILTDLKEENIILNE